MSGSAGPEKSDVNHAGLLMHRRTTDAKISERPSNAIVGSDRGLMLGGIVCCPGRVPDRGTNGDQRNGLQPDPSGGGDCVLESEYTRECSLFSCVFFVFVLFLRLLFSPYPLGLPLSRRVSNVPCWSRHFTKRGECNEETMKDGFPSFRLTHVEGRIHKDTLLTTPVCVDSCRARRGRFGQHGPRPRWGRALF
jgi:hypothetical protein